MRRIALTLLICTACHSPKKIESLSFLEGHRITLPAEEERTTALGTKGWEACVRLGLHEESGKEFGIFDSQPTTVDAPAVVVVDTVLSTECKAWLTKEFPAQLGGQNTQPQGDQDGQETPAPGGTPTKYVWIGTWVWDVFDFANYSSDPAADYVVQKYSIEDIKEGRATFVVPSNHLRHEGNTYIYVAAGTGGPDEGAQILKQARVNARTLRVLDRRLENAFGYRATVPLLWRPDSGTPERFALGMTAAVLWYPVRHLDVPSSFLRSLALEGNFGAITGLEEDTRPDASGRRTFYFIGSGVSYKGVIGGGFAYDITENEKVGLYFNITLFSENGLFGLGALD